MNEEKTDPVDPSNNICSDVNENSCDQNGVASSQIDAFNSENSENLILIKIEKLSLQNNELKCENSDFKDRLAQLEKSCASFKLKAERSAAQVESTKKELQSMVIKYATSEKDVLNLKKHHAEIDRKYRELLKERDSIQNKLKELSTEKKQLLSNVERHILELATLRNEDELLKNKLAQAEVKIEQLQLKLESVSLQLQSSQGKLDKVESSLKKLNQDEYSDEQLDNFDWIDQYLQCMEKNKNLEQKIGLLEKERNEFNNKIEDLQKKIAETNEKMKDYKHKIDLIESLKNELIKKQGVIEDLKQKFDKINDINRDLLKDIESSKHKEAELLEYTERLTAKMVLLQSEHNNLEEKVTSLTEQCDQFRNDYDKIIAENTILKSEYDKYKLDKESELQNITELLNSKTAEAEELKKKIDELENDIKIIKRKHISSLKELNKEIQCLKRNQIPRTPISVPIETNSSTLSSRTNSFNSLSEIGTDSSSIMYRNSDPTKTTTSADTIQPSSQRIHHVGSHDSSNSTTSQQQPNTITQSDSNSNSSSSELITSLNDIDKNALIDRILRLQRTLIKRNEKIDFLEEHNEHLTEEVKKKSKLLQYYILKEETGALATESMDKNKAYISKRGGGIMSSLYNSSSTDDTMTLERSLEINNKLHAVLEDTLLKNMTLKENLNTLALEIDRLSRLRTK